MHIQRHLQIDADKGSYFGLHKVKIHYDFDWYLDYYLRPTKIGAKANPSTEAECFYQGFLVRDDSLLIVPLKDQPKIQRRSDSLGVMRGHDAGIPEIYSLIQLLQSQEVTHAYLTSKSTDGQYPNILTFSAQAPSSELYTPGKILPVSIDTVALEEYDRTNKMIEELDIVTRRVLTRLGRIDLITG